MNIVVYTAIFGNIDRLYPALPNAMGKAEFVCITDHERQEQGIWSYDGLMEFPEMIAFNARRPTIPTWQQEIVEAEYGNRMSARYHKCLPHRIFPEADITIWVDGNVRLRVTPEKLVEQYLPKGSNIASFQHPDRNCVYDEARFCMDKGKGRRHNINAQIEHYRREGMPLKRGLWETKCVIRRNNDAMNKLNEAWWDQICEFSVRDQISLPYVLWKMNIGIATIAGRAAVSNWPGQHNKQFWMVKHVKGKS